uniref:Brain cDNA, clone: QccE-15914, similar to human transmembrane protein 9 (TMEM9) n=1 Tax=Macaca fascicularis TaxID=9541 RepID=Q4R576_MACFA|nr:unnamed protein product [Macaca fascicularis]
MAFLMLVDPLIRKPDAYTEQLHNEEENEDARSMAAACCIPRGTPSKHRPGARGRCPAAVEAAGAGAAEDSLRSAQDAQLDGLIWLGQGLNTMAASFQAGQSGGLLLPSLGASFPFKSPWHFSSSSLTLEILYLTILIREEGCCLRSLLSPWVFGVEGRGKAGPKGMQTFEAASGVDAVCLSWLHSCRLPAPSLGNVVTLGR